MIKEGELTRSFKDGDDKMCVLGGVRLCNVSRKDRNYFANYVISVIFDFIVPLAVIGVFLILSISGYFPFIIVPPLFWVFGGSDLLVAFVVVLVVDSFLVIIMIYRLGSLALIPVGISVVFSFVGLVPVIGELVAYVVAVIPWWIIMTSIHLIIFQISRESGEL